MTLANGELKVSIWTWFNLVVQAKAFWFWGIGLSVSAEGVSGLLGFFIFDSDSSLMKCSKIRIMGKDHLSSEVR